MDLHIKKVWLPVVTRLVNGKSVATGRMEHAVPARFSGYAGMDIGCDNGLVVDRSYADKAPFRFTGEIKQVVIDIAPVLSENDRQSLHEHAEQALAAGGLGELGGEFARKRVLAGIGEKMDDALPSGAAAVIAIYDHDDAKAVATALANAIRTSTIQVDKASVKELKAGLEKASAGLAG